MGAVGLSFRVRDGSGRFPHAMAAVTLFHRPVSRVWGGWCEVFWCCVYVIVSCFFVFPLGG
jgi:hypothetical protein